MLNYAKANGQDFQVGPLSTNSGTYIFKWDKSGNTINLKGHDLADWQDGVNEYIQQNNTMFKNIFNLKYKVRDGNVLTSKSLIDVFKKDKFRNQLEQPGLKPYGSSPIGFLFNLKIMLDDESTETKHNNTFIQSTAPSGRPSQENKVRNSLANFKEKMEEDELGTILDFMNSSDEDKEGNPEKKDILDMMDYFNKQLKEKYFNRTIVAENKHLPNLLEKLVNNHINQRKQKWQKRTT